MPLRETPWSSATESAQYYLSCDKVSVRKPSLTGFCCSQSLGIDEPIYFSLFKEITSVHSKV